MYDFTISYSYIALCVVLFISIGLISVFMGVLVAISIIFCIYIGVIRIGPLCNYMNKLIHTWFPNTISTMKTNLHTSFQMSGNTSLQEKRYIFMWHPHGVFPTTLFFHTCTTVTNAPTAIQRAKTIAFSGLKWIPFADECICELLGILYSDYSSMKQALVENTSISLYPGGMREMMYEDSVILSRRRGIFKMALETGTPLVPIVSIGETSIFQMYSLPQWIQDLLKPYDACIGIPTLKTIQKYIDMMWTPLKDPIISVIGDPILVEKVDTPTEIQISDLRSKYIDALKRMYKKEVGKDLVIL